MNLQHHRQRSSGADDEAARVLDLLMEADGTHGFTVGDSSMHPTLRTGDRAVAAPFLGLPRPGQIVLARLGGTPALLRLIDIKLANGRRQYHLQGDAIDVPTVCALREDLLGRVIAVVRQGRRIAIDDTPAALRQALRSRNAGGDGSESA